MGYGKNRVDAKGIEIFTLLFCFFFMSMAVSATVELIAGFNAAYNKSKTVKSNRKLRNILRSAIEETMQAARKEKMQMSVLQTKPKFTDADLDHGASASPRGDTRSDIDLAVMAYKDAGSKVAVK